MNLFDLSPKISGWFDYQDLYNEAVIAAGAEAVFVEVGVFQGKSLCYLAARSLESGKKIAIHGFDNFSQVDGNQHVCEANIRMMIDAGANITLHIGDSAAGAELFADGSVDFVFIDGDHSYEGVKRDIAAWTRKVKPGGMICGHDFTNTWPGCMKAVTELVGSANPRCSVSCWRHRVTK
jgi:predicted O-methyltransferase YrrM